MTEHTFSYEGAPFDAIVKQLQIDIAALANDPDSVSNMAQLLPSISSAKERETRDIHKLAYVLFPTIHDTEAAKILYMP